MLGLGKTRTAGGPAAASQVRSEVIYQRHAAALYRQALLMLDDSARAENVVCDAIVAECALALDQEQGEDETRYRLAESVFRRCQQLAAGPARPRRLPQRPSVGVVGGMDPGGILSEKERGALGLVLCGGLGYVEASTVLRIGPHDMAGLLLTVMRKLAISPAAVAGDGDQV
jgi:hypothetical protein